MNQGFILVKSKLAFLFFLLIILSGLITGHTQYYLASFLHERGFFSISRYFYEVSSPNISESYGYLGVMYLYGQGVNSNMHIAEKYFNKAYDNGVDMGALYIAGMYRGKNHMKSYYWYSKYECKFGVSSYSESRKRFIQNKHKINKIINPCDYIYYKDWLRAYTIYES